LVIKPTLEQRCAQAQLARQQEADANKNTEQQKILRDANCNQQRKWDGDGWGSLKQRAKDFENEGERCRDGQDRRSQEEPKNPPGERFGPFRRKRYWWSLNLRTSIISTEALAP
jgi:hypothetical protein